MSRNYIKQALRWARFQNLTICCLMTALADCDPLAPAIFLPPYTVKFAPTPGQPNPDEVAWRVHLAVLSMKRHGKPVEIGIAGGTLQGAPARIPDHVLMDWKDADGSDMRQELSLVGIVPDMSNFHGTLWFLFDGRHWSVKPVNHDEEIWRAINNRTTAPVD